MIEEIWDSIVDTWDYIISFSWWSDFWESFFAIFESIGEISLYGIVFALISFGTIYMAREYMLYPFLLHMGGLSYWFWMFVTYGGCAFAGYLVGKHFEDTG